MNASFDFIPVPLVRALGWMLIHSLWQGAAMAALFAVLKTALRNHAAKHRYWAGCLAMMLLAAAPVLTLCRINQPDLVAVQDTPKAGSSAMTLPNHDTRALSKPPIPATANSLPTAPMPAPAKLATTPERWMPWLVGGWLAGVWLLTLRLLAGWLQVRRLKRQSTLAVDDGWSEKLRVLRERLAVARPVAFFQSVLVEVPTVIGLLRPTILVPVTLLTGLPAAQIEALLAHELAHIRRWDGLVNLLQNGLEIVLFYHPAVWWISRCVRDEREQCCDDLAVQVCGDRLEYARALAALEAMRGPLPAWALGAASGALLPRIRRLLDPPRPTHGLAGWGMAGLVVITVALAAGFGNWGTAAAKNADQKLANKPVVESMTMATIDKEVGNILAWAFSPIEPSGGFEHDIRTNIIQTLERFELEIGLDTMDISVGFSKIAAKTWTSRYIELKSGQNKGRNNSGEMVFRGQVNVEVNLDDVRHATFSCEQLNIQLLPGKMLKQGQVFWKKVRTGLTNDSLADLKLTCERISIQTSYGEPMSLVAEGGVVLEKEGFVAKGGRLVYDSATDEARLTDDPKVMKTPDKVQGPVINYERKDDSVVITGLIRHPEFKGPSQAQLPTGSARVMQIRGSATYQETNGGPWQPLIKGMLLREHSAVKTAPNSLVDLLLTENGPLARGATNIMVLGGKKGGFMQNGPVVRITADTTVPLAHILKEGKQEGVVVGESLTTSGAGNPLLYPHTADTIAAPPGSTLWFVADASNTDMPSGNSTNANNHVYESKAQMWVAGKVPIPEGKRYNEEMAYFMATQTELLKSDIVRERAKAALLKTHPSASLSNIRLEVETTPAAAIINLRAIGDKAPITQAFLNAIMDEYLQFKSEASANTARFSTLTNIMAQAVILGEELKHLRKTLNDFQSTNNVIFLQQQNESDASRLAAINRELRQKQSELKLLQSTNAESLIETNFEFSKASLQYQTLKAKRDELAKSLDPSHPKLKSLDEEIADQERLVRLIKKQSLAELENRRQYLQRHITNFEEEFKELEPMAMETMRKVAEYDRLNQQVKATQALCDRLIIGSLNVDASKIPEQEPVAIWERASLPRTIPMVKESATLSVSPKNKIEPAGGGKTDDEASANYFRTVMAIYDMAWTAPTLEAKDDSLQVVAVVTIARSGKVKEARIITSSGNRTLDQSVRQLLDRVQSVPPFPEGAQAEERVYTITFNTKAKTTR